jgi:hypothetical protein
MTNFQREGSISNALSVVISRLAPAPSWLRTASPCK